MAYEVEQFVVWSLKRPPVHPDEDIDLRLRQACFEVAILHRRNLVDFLVNDRPTTRAFASDLVADHYFDRGWSSKPDPFLLYDTRDENKNAAVRQNVNRHLAHITTFRQELRASGRPFEWDEIDPELVLAGFLRFLRDLASKHPDRVEWFRDSQDNAASALAAITRIRASGGGSEIVTSTSATFEIVTSGALDPNPASRWMI